MTNSAAQILADFTARVATLDSETLRNLYRELFAQEMPFQMIDVVLDRLMDLDGTEAISQFIDTVG